MFSGCITALVTPFKNGKIDYKKLLELIDFQIENGVSGLVLCGTTGEGATLNDAEKEKIFRISVKHNRKRISLIAGTGTNDTAKTIKLTQMAQSTGMDAALIVTPYYNKPTQEGLYLHYRAVSNKVRFPIIIYNVPGRTGVSITPETVARLAIIKNIVAIKDASGDLDYVSHLRKLSTPPEADLPQAQGSKKKTASEITILSGEDALTFPMLCLGGKGVISVVSNIAPKDVVKMIEAFNNGRLEIAKEYHLKLFPLVKALFIESNPIPVKTALKIIGKLNGEMRLPLCPMTKQNAVKLRIVLKDYPFRVLAQRKPVHPPRGVKGSWSKL